MLREEFRSIAYLVEVNFDTVSNSDCKSKCKNDWYAVDCSKGLCFTTVNFFNGSETDNKPPVLRFAAAFVPPTFVGSIFSCFSFEWQNGRDFGLVDFAGVFPVILEIEAIV